MADMLLVHLKRVRIAMHNITETVALTLSHPSTAQEDLQTRLQHMTTSLMFPVSVSGYRRLQSEHEAFIDGFTRLLAVVMLQVTRLEGAADSNERSLQVWIIWELFTVACRGWMKWTELENANTWGRLPAQSPDFIIALSSLTAWLLSASRNNSYAWVKLHSAQSLEKLVSQLYLVLFIPCNILFNTYAASPPSTAAVVGSFTNLCNHISVLCCLVHEQLGEHQVTPLPATHTGVTDTYVRDRPGRVRNRGLITQLVTALAAAVNVSRQFQSQPLLDALTNPSVIELMQLEVVLQREERQHQPLTSAPEMLVALMYLLENRVNMLHSRQEVSSSSGFDLLPRSTVSHCRLLCLLCGPSVPLDHPIALVHVRVMDLLLDCWDRENSASLGVSTQFCGTLATLAHHCSSRTLVWMQSFQTHGQRRRHSARLSFTALQREQQREAKGPVKVMFSKTILVLVRCIMGVVSNICLQDAAAEDVAGRYGRDGRARQGTYIRD